MMSDSYAFEMPKVKKYGVLKLEKSKDRVHWPWVGGWGSEKGEG